MRTSEFESRALKVFGPKWRFELPRHYKISTRAMRYWQSGEINIPSEVASDLLAWTGPHGHHAFLLAQINRAYRDTTFDSGRDEMNFLDTLTAWYMDRHSAASRRDYLEDRDAELRADEIRLAEHDRDEAFADQHFAWISASLAPSSGRNRWRERSSPLASQ